MSLAGRLTKRFFDISVSLIGVIFLIPITLFIKIAYFLTGDRDSIFYSQTRLGKDGKLFKIYKFRTMIKDADGEPLRKLLKDPKYKAEWDKNQKFENDPRVTKIGKLIRHASIDETPQFLNILAGNLSLVGPRPLTPGECESHGGDRKKYESVRPGLTGNWAASGRSSIDFKTRLELEYYYIENQSLFLDLKIIFKTFAAVLFGTGAK